MLARPSAITVMAIATATAIPRIASRCARVARQRAHCLDDRQPNHGAELRGGAVTVPDSRRPAQPGRSL
jgi:hypothetical protein